MSNSIPYSSLPQTFFETAFCYPGRLAVSDPTSGDAESLTFEQMSARIFGVAHNLVGQRVQTGDRVGLVSAGRSWWPICDFAILTIGARTVPVYPSLPPGQLGFIVRHSGMSGIFVEDAKQFAKLVAAHQEEPLPIRFVVILNEQECRAIDALEAPWPVFSYRSWSRQTADEAAVRNRLRDVQLDDVATIVYTSGTTGLPKGVLLTNRNILSNYYAVKERLDIGPNDVHLSYLPLSHIFERTCGEYIPLLSGSAVYYATSIDTIVADFARVQPTMFTTVPRLLEKVQERVEGQMRQTGGIKQRIFESAMAAGAKMHVEGQRVSSLQTKLYDKLVYQKIKQGMGGRLRFIVSGGAPLSPHVCRFFMALGMQVYEGYGMTETSPVIAFNSPDAPRLGTVGRRLSNVDVTVAEDGELLVRGPSVSPGYYDNEEANLQAYTEDGWLRTGDLAEVSADGYIKITDRKKHLIVLSTGKKVTPAPIEAEILQSPYIDQVCLVGQARKFVAAVVVPNEQAIARWQRTHPELAKDPAQIVAFLEAEVERATAQFARFEQPKRIVLAEPFTIENDLLTPSLKVKPKQVGERYRVEIDELYRLPTGDVAPSPRVVAGEVGMSIPNN
ncbi:long-chain fatty acid--CoA ligase [Alicyclobacillus fastidiosus]|uniref:Long-chain fatty acid--CoA ligase n=1 Tax=Alicyclobacillus fastidiosus TaxID=392011 RepID=A0ABY6ZEA3_9BACL|nr:long-chain fatty acid--CoA ligase [Alicyclobacillus fastidiosus]WAH40878.1 long-chain fatty acid--CoA ligase [Alicyclobacillus fastidiosus]